MFIYVFPYVKVTNSYHSGGGLLVCASDQKEAKKLVRKYNKSKKRPGKDDEIELDAKDWAACTIYALDSSHVKSDETVQVFPDQGCC